MATAVYRITARIWPDQSRIIGSPIARSTVAPHRVCQQPRISGALSTTLSFAAEGQSSRRV
ncbi:hypothetical protein AA0474_2225 [Acetobacter lovaniensis NRIC 0474]|nr:hypothetical protein AA0474_2225 [Acetobacter lovaniensis NRIC 0474]